jgi:hypothetical protein
LLGMELASKGLKGLWRSSSNKNGSIYSSKFQ